MTRGQRLAVIIGSAALLLALGRAAAVLYADYAWYASLGALSVWNSKISQTTILYGGALLVGALFAFCNLFAVRRSIVALMLPKRLGNVEFDEEVLPSRLVIVTAAMSLCASAIGLLALPPWTTLAIARSGVRFGEIDPYFGLDLSHYVAWFPLESSIHVWAFLVFAIVALLVITLYALTPSLRWGRNGLLITTYARRHLSVLAAMLIAFIAWGMRIEAFGLLTNGNGPNGMFTRIDHQWLIPAYTVISLVVLGASVVLLVAGWLRQTQTAFIVVTAVILALAIVKGVLPWFSGEEAQGDIYENVEDPYQATRELYTSRAFPKESTPPSVQYEADSAILAQASSITASDHVVDIVYPGAHGYLIESDSMNRIAAPIIGSWFSKIMTAWAEQNPHLLKEQLKPNSVIVRHRDVHKRVKFIAPIFAQSQTIGIRPTPTGIVWIVDLYSISDSYPLSIPQHVGDGQYRYRRHAATAYVNAATGGVDIVATQNADPIARAWFASHPGNYIAQHSPVLSDEVAPIVPIDSIGTLSMQDSAYKAKVARIYLWMRTALQAGDFKAFGDALDSLGKAVGISE